MEKILVTNSDYSTGGDRSRGPVTASDSNTVLVIYLRIRYGLLFCPGMRPETRKHKWERGYFLAGVAALAVPIPHNIKRVLYLPFSGKMMVNSKNSHS